MTVIYYMRGIIATEDENPWAETNEFEDDVAALRALQDLPPGFTPKPKPHPSSDKKRREKKPKGSDE
jgi:hypothetical protein